MRGSARKYPRASSCPVNPPVTMSSFPMLRIQARTAHRLLLLSNASELVEGFGDYPVVDLLHEPEAHGG